ncbi:ABC-2 type transport system permease protein [Virgibacillus subterraneus]|uniref:ABC-2 type transport system permease protein n=1 Tax=Virgibacillus subterraneus TaxID=621109 RepID=A0A1H9FSS9_9BACI|nr:ABC transporter permease [Virgibacillus subterraneus]SEQ40954.1 ABC-2 type transport system permease protein [Virgibacillus subterraneus]
MNKFWIILSHTYMTKFKTKSFLISTIISLVFIFAIANIQTITETFSGDTDKIAVIDESGELFTPLEESVEGSTDEMDLIAFEGAEEDGKNAVQDEEYAALITLSLNAEGLPEATYFANNIAEAGEQSVIQQQLQQLKVAAATQQAGVDQETITEIYSPVTFSKIALDDSAKTAEELNQARGIVYVMLFLLYISVITYGTMIANDVATEKSSRVMEILISSASPVTHMFAKIVGIALLGLTQVGIIIGVGYSLIMSKQEELTGGVFDYFGIQNTSASVYIYAIVFFLLGYLLYATLAAMLGSLVSRTEDVQQMIMPMILLVMIAFFIAMFGLEAPDSSFVKITSYIPFFAPMLMFLRVGMLDIPFWEVALSIGILIATILLFAAIGARVYKGGVLMYGRSSSLKDVKKAIALSKKE